MINLRDITLKCLWGSRISQKSFDYDLVFKLRKPGNLVEVRHKGGDSFTILGLKEMRRIAKWANRYVVEMEKGKRNTLSLQRTHTIEPGDITSLQP